MKTLSNTLKKTTSTWSDPGVYPSNAGGGPLSSYKYVDSIEGSIIVELDAEDEDLIQTEWGGEWEEYITEMASTLDLEIPSLRVIKWGMTRTVSESRTTVEITVEDFECDYVTEYAMDGDYDVE